MKIQAIETRYNGYRFRSRLEARWAVFFDSLDIRYEYEKEGFDLGEKGWYLPDFWLLDLKIWYEVKGELTRKINFGLTTSWWSCPEISLIQEFKDLQEWPCALAVGSVGEEQVWFYGWDICDSSAGSYDDMEAHWCFSNDIATLDVGVTRSDRYIVSDNLCGEVMEQFTYSRDYGVSNEPIWEAYTAARSARFEHGEKGYVKEKGQP